MNRVMTKYKETVAPELKNEFGYKNIHQVPKITKVVLNIGAGRAAGDSKLLDVAKESLSKITGQAAVSTKAKQSIAGFKIRQGQNIGAMVTLRGQRAYEFIDRLVSVVLPRIRDFRGLNPKAFDGRGGFSLGISDLGIFPEAAGSEGGSAGLQVNIVTNAKTDAETLALLRKLGFPFRSEE